MIGLRSLFNVVSIHMKVNICEYVIEAAIEDRHWDMHKTRAHNISINVDIYIYYVLFQVTF